SAPALAVRILGGAPHLRVALAQQQRIRRADFGANQAKVVRRVEEAWIPAPPPGEYRLDPFTQCHRSIRLDSRPNLYERFPRGKRGTSHFPARINRGTGTGLAHRRAFRDALSKRRNAGAEGS